jgi:hypothetical protein
MAAHDLVREAMKTLGLKVRPPLILPTHNVAIQPPLSPTPKIRYVTKPKMKRNDEEWYQMIGTGVPVVFVMVFGQVARRGHEAPLGVTVDRDRMRPAVQGGGSAGITHIYPYPGIPRVLDHGRRRQDKPTAVATGGGQGRDGITG